MSKGKPEMHGMSHPLGARRPAHPMGETAMKHPLQKGGPVPGPRVGPPAAGPGAAMNPQDADAADLGVGGC